VDSKNLDRVDLRVDLDRADHDRVGLDCVDLDCGDLHSLEQARLLPNDAMLLYRRQQETEMVFTAGESVLKFEFIAWAVEAI
jgi:hypothetical protein